MELGDFVKIHEPQKDSLGIGKLISVDDDGTCVVTFFDKPNNPLFRVETTIDCIEEIDLIRGTTVYYEDVVNKQWHSGKVLKSERGSSEIKFDNSTLETNFFSSSDLYVRLSKRLERPAEFLAEKLYSSRYLRDRRIDFIDNYEAAKHAIGGLTGYFSSLIELEKHQHRVVKIISDDAMQRYLLADEVGLGKTVEAGALIRQYALDFPLDHKVLVLVPDHLVHQWTLELQDKFKLQRLLKNSIRVFGFSDLDKIKMHLKDVGMVVIDEAHNLNSEKNPDLFDVVKDKTQAINRLLLLSATPVLNNEKLFHEVLQVLDPSLYRAEEFDRFRAQVKNEKALNEVIQNLTPESFLFINDRMDQLCAMFPKDEQIKEYSEKLFDLSISGKDPGDPIIGNYLQEVRGYVQDGYKLDNRILRNRRENVIGLTTERSSFSFVNVHDSNIENFIDEFGIFYGETKFLDLSDSERLEVTEWFFQTLCFFLERRTISRIEKSFLSLVPKAIETKVPFRVAELKGLFEKINDEWTKSITKTTLEELIAKKCDKVIYFCADAESASEVHDVLLAEKSYFEILKVEEKHHACLQQFNTLNVPAILICGGELEEGLNLHGRNRTVVLFDLPINPNRIEQRIGRVDRYGSSDFHVISLRDNSNEVERKLHEINEGVLKVFQRSIASLQYSIEHFYGQFRQNLATEGFIALDILSENLTSQGGITSELDKIKQQEVMDSLGSRHDQSFEDLESVDENWQEFRRVSLSWISDCLKFKEKPVIPYLYVGVEQNLSMEKDFWSKFANQTVTWTTPESYNELSENLEAIFEAHDITSRFVACKGTNQAFKMLRDDQVELLVLSDDHARKIATPIFAKRLGSGAVEGSEIKQLSLSNNSNFSAEQTISIFSDHIDYKNTKNIITSKYFKVRTEPYSYRRQTALTDSTSLLCVGNELIEKLRWASDTQMDGRCFVNWRHVRGYPGQKLADAFMCVSVFLRGDVDKVLEVAEIAKNRRDTNFKRAFQQKLDRYLQPRVINVWLDENHLIVEDPVTLLLLNKRFSPSLQTNGYEDQQVSRRVIDAVSKSLLTEIHGSWADFIRGGENVVAIDTSLDKKTMSELDVAAEELCASEKRILKQRLMRQSVGDGLEKFASKIDKRFEEKIISAMHSAIRNPKIEVESLGVLFVSSRPLKPGF